MHIGESEDTPRIAADPKPLHLSFPVQACLLPCTLTLRIGFPGWPPEAAPELFTFLFREFSDPQ